VCFFRLVLGTGTGKPLGDAGGGTELKSSSCFLKGIYVLGGNGGLCTGELSPTEVDLVCFEDCVGFLLIYSMQLKVAK